MFDFGLSASCGVCRCGLVVGRAIARLSLEVSTFVNRWDLQEGHQWTIRQHWARLHEASFEGHVKGLARSECVFVRECTRG